MMNNKIKNDIIEFMSGHYTDDKIEEFTIFIDSLLNSEVKE